LSSPAARLPSRLAVYTDSEVRGGAEQVLANLLPELSPEIGVTVVGVAPAIVEWIASTRPGSRTLLMPPVRTKRDLTEFVTHIREVRRLRPELMHVNQPTPWMGQYGIAAGLLTPGTKVVAVEHSPIQSPHPLQRRLRRLLSTRLAAHVSVGERAARMVEESVGLPPGSVQAIPNGVPERPPPDAERLAEGPVLGTITRIDPHKGLDLFVAALEAIPEATGIVVGEGPELENLRRSVERRGLAGRLLTPGFQSDPRRYLAGFDVFVLPSNFEALPLAVLEAMLAGLPVVATAVGSVPEAVRDGETGLLVEPRDGDALTAALRRLIDDPGLRERMGREGRALALQHFTAARMARDYERLYSEVVSAGR
jgi:glycosyltransferase involved in cell wall biosynthesis